MKIFKNNIFLKRILVLVTGSALGQVVAIAALPFLTRLYSAEAFAVLAVYVSILTIVSSISGLCFEYAVPLPKSQRIAATLCLLAVFCTLFFTCVLFILLFLFPELLNNLIGNDIEHYLWLIPFGVFFIGIYNALQYWSSRNKRFSLIAKTRVTQSVNGTGVKLVFGYFFSAPTLGLIVGQLLAQSWGFISLAISLIKNDIKVFMALKFKYFILAIKKYKKFPKFTTLEVLSNTASIQLPILLIAYYAVDEEVGYLMIATQLISAPLGMLSGAVSQVYFAEGADKYHQGLLRTFTLKTIGNLIKVAIIPLLLVLLCAPIIIPYLLGETWERTGILMSWMVPWFFIQFITSPISTVLYFTENQQIAFLLQIFGLLIRVSIVWVVALYSPSFVGEAYALSGLLFYLVYLMVVLKVVNQT